MPGCRPATGGADAEALAMGMGKGLDKGIRWPSGDRVRVELFRIEVPRGHFRMACRDTAGAFDREKRVVRSRGGQSRTQVQPRWDG
ncbi:hypothetical protein HYQ46_012241 [Verticillium longisporum]|nr:hypothetical protein HYQ46_012241 [Verticillium longisporum]